jgi:hypothetical protein
MRRKIVFTLLVVLVLVGSSFFYARRLSNWIVSPRFESDHFRFYSDSGDTALAKSLESVLERDYARLKQHYERDVHNKINIRLFTSNQLFNMAFGNPLPLPRRAGNYGGQHIDHDVYALIPADWKPQPDSVFPPERGRTTVAHEMAHAFVFDINPDVRGWITEGIAQYEQTAEFNDLTRKYGFAGAIGKDVEAGRIPKFSELFAGHRVTSPEITGDYLFAGSFIDFASVTYGFRSISAFVKTNDFSASFGQTESGIWEGWVQYLREHYVSQRTEPQDHH